MALEINNLTKTYNNGVKALNNLSLKIEKGMFGLLGPNGAGKSTLMRTIVTLQNPDSGSLLFNGINILNDKMELRKILGYLPQEFGVYPKISGEDLLLYFAMLKGIKFKKDREKLVEEVLTLTNLYDDKEKYVSGYSGGMRQRFGIAQLLLNKPQLIVVDEPTAGLDPAERNRFLNVLRGIGTNNTVIFSTHIVEDVKELCTDMAIMNNGRILKKTSPSQSTSEIENKIWTKKILKEDLEIVKKQHLVLSSNYSEDNTINIRIFAQEKPDASFATAIPNLEDVYFITLHENE